MLALKLSPVILSLLILGAHFFRAGSIPGVIVCVVLLVMLFVRRPWVARVVQAALVIGAVEWGLTLRRLADARMMSGQPYLRLVVILAAVALACAMSALAFNIPAVRWAYGLAPRQGSPAAGEGPVT